ncbi:MAG: biotin/lipoyl-binding protein [Acidobacteriota bacterium]|nr:biotin/lipoyl-binding protein [Acidobacteriota bacterium]
MKRKLSILAGLLIATTLTLSAFYGRGDAAAPAVTRGSVVTTVAATGSLEAVTTVQVGSQVSGAVDALYADFNSIVKKGQVLARLDPSLYNSAIEQAQANLISRPRPITTDFESHWRTQSQSWPAPGSCRRGS